MYYIKAVNKGKVGYRCRANDIVADTVYSLFSLLVYIEIDFIFGVELIIDSELVLV
jgi:hypothetical protein